MTAATVFAPAVARAAEQKPHAPVPAGPALGLWAWVIGFWIVLLAAALLVGPAVQRGSR